MRISKFVITDQCSHVQEMPAQDSYNLQAWTFAQVAITTAFCISDAFPWALEQVLSIQILSVRRLRKNIFIKQLFFHSNIQAIAQPLLVVQLSAAWWSLQFILIRHVFFPEWNAVLQNRLVSLVHALQSCAGAAYATFPIVVRGTC